MLNVAAMMVWSIPVAPQSTSSITALWRAVRQDTDETGGSGGQAASGDPAIAGPDSPSLAAGRLAALAAAGGRGRGGGGRGHSG
jgi:hypothetical protein